MPCNPIYDAQGRRVGIACTRGRGPARCTIPGCTSPGDILCDFPIKGRTCDRRICRVHAKHVGRDRDLCPEHAERPRAAGDGA